MKRFKYNYSPGSDPAPGVIVDLTHGNENRTVRGVAALVDTGADQTVIPLRILDPLGVRICGEQKAVSFDNEESLLPLYEVRIRIWDFNVVTLVVMGSPDVSDVVLGRDMLNLYTIILDGPNRKLEITGE